MDQLRGPGKHADGPSSGEGSLRGGIAASEMVRAAASRGGAERGSKRQRTRIAGIPGKKLRALAVARCLCVHRCHSAHQRRQIQEDRVARTVCWMEMEELSATGAIRAGKNKPL